MGRIEEIGARDLISEGLHYAAEHAAHTGNAYRVVILSVDGDPQILELLHFEASQRTGVAWHGCDWWLDAASVEEAIQRWIAGEGKMSASSSKRIEANP